MILEYVMKFHLQDCIAILSEKDTLGYFSIKIDFLKLFESYPDVGDKVLCEAVESLPLCNKDIIKAQQNILEFDTYKDEVGKLKYCSLKRNVQARFFGLPVCPELHRAVFPKNVDLGCFLKVTGTVVRVTQSKMLEYQRKYVCMKCKHENCIEAEFENRYILRAPTKCRNEESRCKCSTFTQVNMVSREFCKDYQEIKIQEQVNKLSIGTIPGSMWVVLENDLVDCCKPGDDVVICGTVRRRWRPSVQTKKSEVELVLQANYLEVCNARQSEVIATAPDVKDCFKEFWSKYELCPLKGRDQILKTVCPQVYGLYSVKLAVLLTVITGSNHIKENETDKKSLQDEGHAMRVRGQCHLLLVGDPGTGKSQLLRAGVDLTARSVFTSGAGSTRAGLTCAALREDGEWQLEAGALVLSDGGVCCIDEISQLREHDRTAIHEAMEQQTLSIAKAGIVCKLNTRCAIIAACNPKGHYATDQTLSANVSLGTPLLSRFDLIFILLDSKHKAWDKLVSSYILFGGSNAPDLKNKWSLEKLQMYISLVGPRQTEMTRSANTILQSYYMAQRKSEHRDPSRTTVRMLDSLVRLAQAHCRLMYRTTILPMDAIVAVSLVDLSMQDCTLSDTVDALHSTFQKYPDFEYLCTSKKLLTKLHLHDIWQKELLYYGRLMQVDCRTLESDIDNGSYRLFAKCDDILDDNVHLSSSLVTSSYFNANKKDSEDLSLKGDKEYETVENPVTRKVNEKLAKTLKKHANLNKEEKNLPAVLAKKVTNKRKRKQVTANTFALNAKIAKQSKTSARSVENTASSDNEASDAIDIMNAVPSVNDIFTDLGINFEIGTNHLNHVTNNHAERKSQLEADTTIINSCSTQNNSIKEMDKQGKPCSSKTISKLKEFECIKKHDYTKFTDISIKEEEKSNDNLTEVLVKSKQNSSSSSTNQKTSAPSSQISIFESSDYEINLDF